MAITTYIATGSKSIDGLPKQAQEIVTFLRAGGSEGTERKTLLGGLQGVLATRQPVERILAFYLPLLKEKGYVKAVVEVTEVPVRAKSKAAAAPKAKAKMDDDEEDVAMKKLFNLTVHLNAMTTIVPGYGERRAEACDSTLAVVRVFTNGDVVTLLCGQDYEEHDLWALVDGKACLVGTLSKDRWQAAIKATELNLEPSQFDWAPDGIAAALSELGGDHITATAAKKVIDGATYTEISAAELVEETVLTDEEAAAGALVST